MGDRDKQDHSRRERRATAIALLLAAPVALDVFGGVFSRPAAALEHVLVQAVLAPAIQLDRIGGLEHDPVLLQLEAVVLTGLFVGAWRATVSRPRVRAVLRALVGLPAAAAALALVGVGAGLDPVAFVVAGLAASGGAWLGGRGARPAREFPPWALTAGAFALIAAVVNGATVVASGPGDPPTPLWVATFLDRVGVDAGFGWTWALGLGVSAGFGWGLSRFTGPVPPRLSLDPLEAARRASVLAVAAVAALWHVAVTGFLGCSAVLAQPPVDLLLDSAGAFAVEAVHGDDPAAFVAFREKGVIARIGLPDGELRVVDVRDLPLEAYAAQEADLSRRGFPEELGAAPGGAVYAFVEVPGPTAVTAMLTLDPSTGAVDRVLERPGACFVSSWAWDAAAGRGIAGCEWWGDVMIHPADGTSLDRVSIEGAGEMEELLVAPDGTWRSVSLWTSPRLMAVDPVAGAVDRSAFVGGFNWALAPSVDWSRLYLGRFHARQVLELDAETLAPRRTFRVGYGVRSIAHDDARKRLLAASTYDGFVYAVDVEGRRATERLHLGGWVRDMALAESGGALVAGGICGVLRVDLEMWLGPADEGAEALPSGRAVGGD